MQIQNVAKHDLLARNEAVICTSLLTFIHSSFLQDEVEAREKLYKEASTNYSNLVQPGLVHIYTSGVTELV